MKRNPQRSDGPADEGQRLRVARLRLFYQKGGTVSLKLDRKDRTLTLNEALAAAMIRPPVEFVWSRGDVS